MWHEVDDLVGCGVSGLGIPRVRTTVVRGSGAQVPVERSSILEDNPELSKRKMQEQVSRLQAAADEVFKAPRQRLSQAVGKLVCARLCPFPHPHPHQGRLASQGKGLSGDQASFTSLRVCMCYRDRISLQGSTPGEEACVSGGPGVVVSIVTTDDCPGKEGEVVWVMAVATGDTERSDRQGGKEGSSARPVFVAGVSIPKGLTVRQVAFYGTVPGVPTQNKAQLAIILQSSGQQTDGSGSVHAVHMVEYEELPFLRVGSLLGFQGGMRAEGGSHKVSFEGIVDAARMKGAEIQPLGDLGCRSRELPGGLEDVAVALSGARGTACVVSASRLLVLDI
ncbi:unnamed protein product, partial [Discosporangium mesarthrocarpum]